MTISATVIADSISRHGERITTLQLRYPRFIHAELMTHRVLSRNASSSRAIPVKRLIQDIIDDTAMPIHWGKNQPGMQANEEHDGKVGLKYIATDSQGISVTRLEAYDRVEAWYEARDRAIEVARAFDIAGYHKQIVNRLLEPFSHINVLVTATEWKNFFDLRRHPDAQPEINELADRMWDAMEASKVTFVADGQWHLPYITYEEKKLYDLNIQVQCSVARCARVSYLTTEGTSPTVEQDVKLYERLVGSVPLHASPAEHQATPDVYVDSGMYETYGWRGGSRQANFVGWISFRKHLEGG